LKKTVLNTIAILTLVGCTSTPDNQHIGHPGKQAAESLTSQLECIGAAQRVPDDEFNKEYELCMEIKKNQGLHSSNQ